MVRIFSSPTEGAGGGLRILKLAKHLSSRYFRWMRTMLGHVDTTSLPWVLSKNLNTPQSQNWGCTTEYRQSLNPMLTVFPRRPITDPRSQKYIASIGIIGSVPSNQRVRTG